MGASDGRAFHPKPANRLPDGRHSQMVSLKGIPGRSPDAFVQGKIEVT